MRLYEIRKKFIELTGRYDLVTSGFPVVGFESWANNGADYFINSGQRMLDRMVIGSDQESHIFERVSSGEYYLLTNNAITIEKVFLSDSSGRTELGHVDYDKFKRDYGQAGVTPGRPYLYTVARIWSPQNDDMGDLADLIEYSTNVLNPSQQGVLFYPPTDKDYVIEILGNFVTPDLIDPIIGGVFDPSSEVDKSYWSVNHPNLLIMCAAYQLEVSYRNTEGARDWLGAIQLEVDLIDKAKAQQEAITVRQIEG